MITDRSFCIGDFRVHLDSLAASVSQGLKITNVSPVAGPIMLIQAVVPHMVVKGKGKIVNVGSIVSFATGPFTGVYAASKAALHASTEALR